MDSLKQKYDRLVELYKNQANMSHRTSQSVLFAQYSTPVYIGYLMGLYTQQSNEALELLPEGQANMIDTCAGNGALTIAFEAKDCIVNEIDDTRFKNLEYQEFKKVLKQDAEMPFEEYKNSIPCVVVNPPFGKTDPVKYGNISIGSLEMLMALRAIDTMSDNGKCAIIIGGHTAYDKEGRIQQGKNRQFFVYLYANYVVEDVINISGRDLYSRQGTGFNTRIILVGGRKKTPSGFPPIIEAPIPMNEINSYTPVNSFEVLWERVNKSMNIKEPYKQSPTVTEQKPKVELVENIRDDKSDKEALEKAVSFHVLMNTNSDGKKNQTATTAEFIRDFDLENDTIIKSRYKDLSYWVKKMYPKLEQEQQLRYVPFFKEMEEKVSKVFRDYAEEEEKKGNYHSHHKRWTDKEFGLTKEELFLRNYSLSSSDVIAHEISGIKKLEKAIDDGTIKDLLVVEWAKRKIKLTNETFIPIAIKFEAMKDNIGVKRVLTEKEKHQKALQKISDEIYNSLPPINAKVLSGLIDEIKISVQPLEELVFKHELERFNKLIKDVLKETYMEEKNADRMFSYVGFDNIFTYNKVYKREERTFHLTDIKLNPNYKQKLNEKIGEYVEMLSLNLLKAVMVNFERITNPIKKIEQISLSTGIKGFEGEYLVEFIDGGHLKFTTKAIGAGGFNIQVFHYRYLSHFVDIIMPNGEKGSFWDIAEPSE